MATNPSSLNAFQRMYFAWATPYYERLPMPMRSEVECLDRWLYSRAGARFWLILIAAASAGVLGLHAIGVPWIWAAFGSVALVISVLIVALGAWLAPARYTPAFVLKFAVPGLLVGCLVVFGLDAADRAMQPGGADAATLLQLGGATATKAVPALLAVTSLLTLLVGAVAAVRRLRDRRELAALRVAQERETTARQLAEARLRLLQGQIQPHFIFNTLAAVQHWVDAADPRAGPLLRSLTSFLRGSTDLLAQSEVPFDVELGTVRDYLAIMSARLGDRLRFEIVVDERAGRRCLPPGLLLTLVENAIEHGLAPALRGGTVAIDVREDDRAWTLRVADDGSGLSPQWTEGVGLLNCRERLGHRFGPAASLSVAAAESGTVAIVRVDVAAFG